MAKKKILVAVDLAHIGAQVLDTACAFSKQDDAEIVVITVLPTVPTIVGAFLPANFQTDAIEEAKKGLLARLHDKGVAKDACHLVAQHGVPYDEVLRYARDEKADLIIVGSHAPKASDYLLGSTAAKIVRHAPCSVYVVRPKA